MPSTTDARSAVPAERFAWLLLFGACISVLAVAALLEPDPRGVGTHEQLGLPPCGFLLLTGLPCPGCGLTTAFAHGIRGQWIAAASANPLGLVLFFVSCATLVVSVLALQRRWTFAQVFDRFAVHRWALGLAIAGVFVWVVRLAAAV